MVYKNEMVIRMKVLHTSDLHLGKRVHGYSMTEDQRHILDGIVGIVRERKPDAMLIAGDVYDRAVPTEEAVRMFGDFLERVTAEGCEVYVISGNHDSGARLEFCGPILGRSGVHIAGEFSGRAERIDTEDEYGKLSIYMLPYFKVSEVRTLMDADVQGYGGAMDLVMRESGVDPAGRNILVAHQFFAGSGLPQTSESEEQRPEVGGIECIPVDSLAAFDYVALGHLHIPQRVGRDTVRYSGSPLKYSGSEALTPKSVVLADIRGKGDVSVELVPLVPLRDLRVLRGSLDDIVRAGLGEVTGRDDYIIAELSEAPGQGVSELYKVYPHTMNVTVAPRDRPSGTPGAVEMDRAVTVHPADLFAEFYRDMTGEDLSDYQREILKDCIYVGGGEE